LLTNGKFPDLHFKIKEGYLLTDDGQSQLSRYRREEMSAAKLDSAAKFARVLTKLVPYIRTVAVTGSVAYGSAEKWDDIDLFIITEHKRLWISAFLTLILVRLNKLLGLRAPHLYPFCLSYVHDEQEFSEESQRNKTNALFARELLKAKPVAGMKEYRRLLEKNPWVEQFYSAPYYEKLKCLEGGLNGETQPYGLDPNASLLLTWFEGIAYTILSRYLRLRAYLTNLKLKSEGKDLRVFEPIITSTSCVYTSNFYRWLRSLWANSSPHSGSA
jgi:predicted nucleotidyltransferase